MADQTAAEGLGILGFILVVMGWILTGIFVCLGWVIGRWLFMGDKPDWKGTKSRILSIALFPVRKLNKEDNQTSKTKNENS